VLSVRSRRLFGRRLDLEGSWSRGAPRDPYVLTEISPPSRSDDESDPLLRRVAFAYRLSPQGGDQRAGPAHKALRGEGHGRRPSPLIWSAAGGATGRREEQIYATTCQ
jgi:hypothetical protein